jgi:5-methylcytosine-specific restriction endonuclease McrA
MSRYSEDSEFREKHREYVAERQRTLGESCEAWRLLQRIRIIKKKRAARKGCTTNIRKPRRSANELLAREDELRAAWELEKQRRKLNRKPGSGRSPKKSQPKRTEEQIQAGWKVHLHNQWLHEQKKEKRREYQEFMAAWRKKWAHLGGSRHTYAKTTRKRNEQKAATRNSNDKILNGQINCILYAPGTCYWCYKLLPKGGHVDHIIPLAKGGTHTSDNLCASCPDCNSKKSDKTPEEAGLHPTLL